MARRSNKTAHVLSLLTDPKHDTTETGSVEAPQPAPAAPVPDAPSAASAETVPAETTPAEMAQPISEPVSLESGSGVPTPAPTQTTQAAFQQSPPPSTPLSPIDSAQAAEERLSKRIQSSLADALLAEEASAPPAAPAPKPPSVTPPPQHTAPQQQAASPAAPVEQNTLPSEPTSPQFVLVNVMDELLDRFQDDMMRKFGMCTCERCRLDTRALALSNLTGKYVVLNADSVCPMLNFYENRYQSTITAQLTQACEIVMHNPHHTK